MRSGEMRNGGEAALIVPPTIYLPAGPGFGAVRGMPFGMWSPRPSGEAGGTPNKAWSARYPGGLGTIKASCLSCSSALQRTLAFDAGSRRAATGARRDPKTCRETVTDHDRRSTQRRPLTSGFSPDLTVLNASEFHLGNAPWDLTRKRSQVQTLSRPPPFLQVTALPASSRSRSLPGWAALGPRAILAAELVWSFRARPLGR
jgi:hypothetical protein